MKGILGEKIGMTQIFDEANRLVPVTVVRVGGCRVQQIRTVDRDGYSAVQLALGEKRRRRANKPERGNAHKYGIEVPRHVAEVRASDGETWQPGQPVTPDIFGSGEKVDVIGVSKGKGFAGVMKRHNFHGLKASHGAHRVHRHPGSIGMCATPARVLKGTRMAGQLGNRRTTVQNLTVVRADNARELILVRGAVPGPRGGLVMIREAVKKPLKKGGRA